MSFFCREKKFRGKDLTFYRREFEIVKRRFNSLQIGDDCSEKRMRDFFFMDHETRNNIIDTKDLYKVKLKV